MLDQTFDSNVVHIANEPEMAFYCIFGRDGVSECGSYSVDNTECTEDAAAPNNLFLEHRVVPEQHLHGMRRAFALLFAAMVILFMFILWVRTREHFVTERDLGSECAPLISRGSAL